MQTVPLKLVTIVAEAVLADELITLVKSLGARGYTRTEATGEGSRHLRAGTLPGENVRIETVVSPAVADVLIERLSRDYFSNYAVMVYLADVSVVRGEKYV